MQLCDPTAETIPEVLWDDIRTGSACRFIAWRGERSIPATLAKHLVHILKRNQLLGGNGLYLAPSAKLASPYGPAKKYEVTLLKPYVVRCPYRPGGRFLGPIMDLDLDAIHVSHDGIVLIECTGRAREDMRQVIVFSPRALRERATEYGALVHPKTGKRHRFEVTSNHTAEALRTMCGQTYPASAGYTYALDRTTWKADCARCAIVAGAS